MLLLVRLVFHVLNVNWLVGVISKLWIVFKIGFYLFEAITIRISPLWKHLKQPHKGRLYKIPFKYTLVNIWMGFSCSIMQFIYSRFSMLSAWKQAYRSRFNLAPSSFAFFRNCVSAGCKSSQKRYGAPWSVVWKQGYAHIWLVPTGVALIIIW
jgi:hypothetical protein